VSVRRHEERTTVANAIDHHVFVFGTELRLKPSLDHAGEKLACNKAALLRARAMY